MAFGTVKGTFQNNAISIPASFAAALSTGSGVVATGDLVVAVIGEQTALTVSAVTDNLGNTYTAQNAGTLSGTSISGRAFYSRITVAGTITSITATCTSSSDNGIILAVIIQGPFAAPPIDANPANASDTTSPFTAPATGALAQASEVVVAWISSTGSNALSATAPNTLAIQQASASVLEVAIGTQVVSATTTVTPAFTGIAPTADVLGTMSFKQAAGFPNGWQRAADNVKAAAGVWPMVLLATQATTFAVPGPALDNNIVGMGWHQPLSRAAPVAKAQAGFAFVPFDTPQVAPAPNPQGWLQAQSSAPRVAQASPTQATTFAVPAAPSNSVSQFGWHQPLSSPAPVAKPQAGSSFVPLNTAQTAAPSTPSGWQTIQSSAPSRAVINGSALTFVVAPFTVPSGWQSQLSVAPPVAKAQAGSSFVPFNTAQIVPAAPSGWQQPLSGAAPVAKAQAGSAFVPLNAVQATASPPPNGWFGPIAPAPKTATAQPTQATSYAVPPSVAPPAQTPGQFGWYAPLSKAAPVAQAQAGHASVPLNTPQTSTALTLPLVYDAGSPRVANVYYQAWVNPLAPMAPVQNTAQLAWQQPLSVAPKLATVAPQGFAFVPFNTAQVTPTPPSGWQQPLSAAVKSAAVSHTQPVWVPKPFPVLTMAWAQPLSKAAPVTVAPGGSIFVPLNVTPTASMAWAQPLSKAAPVAQAQQGSFFAPLNTAQPSNTVTGFGWYAPLSKAAPVAIAQQGAAFVPLDTAQVAPPAPPIVAAAAGGSSVKLRWGASYPKAKAPKPPKQKKVEAKAPTEAPKPAPILSSSVLGTNEVPHQITRDRLAREREEEAALMAVIAQHLHDESKIKDMIVAFVDAEVREIIAAIAADITAEIESEAG